MNIFIIKMNTAIFYFNFDYDMIKFVGNPKILSSTNISY